MKRLPTDFVEAGGVSLWLQHRALIVRQEQHESRDEWGPDSIYETEAIRELFSTAARRFTLRQERRNRIDLFNDLMSRLKQSLSFR